ncbi:MAG: hypothetical protein Ct9H300mP28_28080 [Pseudomonadota bacterium]|nr:MAG: hypothetical protein Ct9H300mP28_28080 [Pseudomonadota bacterium]
MFSLGNASPTGISLDFTNVSCNGWCFPWTITMLGGTHVCLRKVTAKNIYKSIADYGITHLCGALCDEYDLQSLPGRTL